MRDERISADRFREFFGAVPSAVAVVATTTETGAHGTTVSAFGPLSLDPPLVQVCLDLRSELLLHIGDSRRFSVNVLTHDQEHLARRFARHGRDDFSGVEWNVRHGLPWLAGCRGRLAARVERIVEVGDHVLVIGVVRESEISSGAPLLHHERTFHPLAPAGQDRSA